MNIDFSNDELNKWVQAGLVPQELTTPDKTKELLDFVCNNQQELFAHYRRSKEEDFFQITIPPVGELNKT